MYKMELPPIDNALWDCRGQKNVDTCDLNSPWQIVGVHLIGAHKVKAVISLIDRRMSLSVVDKPNCFVVHPRVRLFSVSFSFFVKTYQFQFSQLP